MPLKEYRILFKWTKTILNGNTRVFYNVVLKKDFLKLYAGAKYSKITHRKSTGVFHFEQKDGMTLIVHNDGYRHLLCSNLQHFN